MMQNFSLFANFSIALISITIANYAISVSFLGRENRLSKWRLEKRKKTFQAKILEMKKQHLEICKLKEEIKKLENAEKKISTRVFLLSWEGAVILPISFFSISLFTSVLGMNSDVIVETIETQIFLEQQLTIFSVATLCIGFIVLLFVIRTIDSVAKKIPVPIFDANFHKNEKTIKMKNNIDSSFVLFVKNIGDDFAEFVDVYVHLPPNFVPESTHYYEIYKQENVNDDFPNYNAVKIQNQFMQLDVDYGTEIYLRTPKEKKKYEIPIYIYERKTGCTKLFLSIEIE